MLSARGPRGSHSTLSRAGAGGRQAKAGWLGVARQQGATGHVHAVHRVWVPAIAALPVTPSNREPPPAAPRHTHTQTCCWAAARSRVSRCCRRCPRCWLTGLLRRLCCYLRPALARLAPARLAVQQGYRCRTGQGGRKSLAFCLLHQPRRHKITTGRSMHVVLAQSRGAHALPRSAHALPCSVAPRRRLTRKSGAVLPPPALPPALGDPPSSPPRPACTEEVRAQQLWDFQLHDCPRKLPLNTCPCLDKGCQSAMLGHAQFSSVRRSPLHAALR